MDETLKTTLSEEPIKGTTAIKKFLLEGDVLSLLKALGYIRVAPRAISMINSMDERIYRHSILKVMIKFRYLHLLPLLIWLFYIIIYTAYGI